MTYTVETIKSKTVTTKFGDKPSYSFKANGEWFNHGFKKPTFGEGDAITFDFTEGKYGKDVDPTSVRKAAPVGGGTAVPKSAAPLPRSAFPISPMDGQRSIIRQNCVTNAREIFCTTMVHDKKLAGMSPDDIATTIINLARKFEAYAAGDLDLLMAKEIAAKPTKAKAEVAAEEIVETF